MSDDQSDNNKPQSYHLALLASVLDNIPASSQNFANSLLRNGKRYTLSDKQMFYVKKLYNDNKPQPIGETPAAPAQPKQPRDDSYLLGRDTSQVLSMFKLAAMHLQAPKIRLYFGHTEKPDDVFSRPKFNLQTTMRVCPASATSKYPGSLYLKPDRGDYSRWYGRIEQDGRFVPGNIPMPTGNFDLEDGPNGERNSVSARTIILAFLCDPVNVSAQMGRLIGRCCYCNRHLEDERSTIKGYGPICANNYGLPWGDGDDE